MLGTLLNTGTVVAGGTLGTVLGDRLPERVRTILLQGMGLAVVALGIRDALRTQNFLVLIGSVALGGLIGEALRLQQGLERLGSWLQERVGRGAAAGSGGAFARGFVTASLIFCVGPMTIVGSFQDGLRGDYSTLAVKSLLDGVTGMALAASLGVGVAFSALFVLAYQGLLTLGAGLLQHALSGPVLEEMTAAGGLLILGIGLGMLEVKSLRVANLLPALAVAPLLARLAQALGAG